MLHQIHTGAIYNWKAPVFMNECAASAKGHDSMFATIFLTVKTVWKTRQKTDLFSRQTGDYFCVMQELPQAQY